MDVEQQQGMWTQLSLFEWREENVRPGASGEGGTGPAAFEEWQATTALNRKRALTSDMMERICERGNLKRAYKRVKANKGAPGVDGITVEEMYGWLTEHKEELVALLRDGSYEPQPVLGVEIEKRGGGKLKPWARGLLWPTLAALADVEEDRGNASAAGDLQAAAREVVQFIADNTPEGAPRTAFLSLAPVRRLFATTDGV